MIDYEKKYAFLPWNALSVIEKRCLAFEFASKAKTGVYDCELQSERTVNEKRVCYLEK